MLANAPVQVPDKVAREVRRILVLVALGGLAIAAALTVAGFYVYRLHRFQSRVLDSIEEVSTESDERARFGESARQLLFAGDFEELERLASDLRASRAANANGDWKLTHFYDALAGLDQASSGFDWARAIEQANTWVERRPRSITARVVLAEQWMASAWGGRIRPVQIQQTDEEGIDFSDRLEMAEEVLLDLEVEESCPHAMASWLRLAVSQRWDEEAEAGLYGDAIRDEPDYLPYYSLHLYYLEPSWEGEPGDWQRAAHAIASGPDGPARYARAVWYRCVRGCDPTRISWPTLKHGFEELLARHPDSFETKSAYCSFAVAFEDLEATRRLLDQIGFRMSTSAWRDRKHFANAHRWATFEDSERSGDPLARLFLRLMGS